MNRTHCSSSTFRTVTTGNFPAITTNLFGKYALLRCLVVLLKRPGLCCIIKKLSPGCNGIKFPRNAARTHDERGFIKSNQIHFVKYWLLIKCKKKKAIRKNIDALFVIMARTHDERGLIQSNRILFSFFFLNID